ncbi:MAG TPA: tetratricopeptide repeat protein, partial [Candidatus Hodarchaeales archaeon]|nr:tetratricopeptide repeat protein [Candidatus Hodarchaeales archaeon]
VGTENEKQYEIARLFHSLKDYDKALSHFIRAKKLGLEKSLSAEADNFIGRIYLKKRKPDLAHRYLVSAFENKNLLDQLGSIYTYANLGNYYHQKNDLRKARELYQQSLAFFSAYGNLSYIFSFFDEISRIDSRIAVEFALKSPLGIIWTVDQYQKSQKSDTADLWRDLVKASEIWWQYVQQDTWSATFQHWKILQAARNLEAKVTSESVLNFVLGANDLSKIELYDEEEGLSPLWFVELPVSIEHGEKILKIRLNNQIQRNSRFLGYPLRGAKGTLSFTPVKRIVVSFRTQWLQELNIDHVFAPNTQIEWDLSKGSPDKVWLKDIFTMDLGEHTQSENALELAYH